MKIAKIIAREIYDSRGIPTIQCELTLDNGSTVISQVPSGTSTGPYEAVELRDGGTRLFGAGVRKAVENIEMVIAPHLAGQELHAIELDVKLIDIDGTPDKSKLGANTLLAVSMALYKAEALAEQLNLYEYIAYIMEAETVTMPFPLINMINGGVHANNNLRIQEFLVVPVGISNFRLAFEAGILVFNELKNILLKEKKHIAVGYEGGFVCDFAHDTEALDLLMTAIETVHAQYKFTCVLGLDIAASQMYDRKKKIYKWRDKKFTSDQLIKFYKELTKNYPIFFLEDGLYEDDWEGWVQLTEELEGKTQIVGDDLFATNIPRIDKGSKLHAANAVVIKPNQIGTVTETLQAIKLCKHRGLSTIVSHRSGETEDTFIADLAVGSSAGYIKAGGCCRSERVAKYNRLLAIEDTLTLNLLS